VLRTSQWESELDRWFEPFNEALEHKVRKKWAPIYVRGLIAPGERKSIVPIAERMAAGDAPQLHHFVAASRWETEPLEEVLVEKVGRLVGGKGSHLIVDDTALPKKGTESVGVTHQYCGALGKQANCQSLVSVTWARDDVPIPVGLRLYLPKEWAESDVRRRKAHVPDEIGFRPKWQIALDELRRIKDWAGNESFDDVLADAGYGMVAEFRHGLDDLHLLWAVGILSTQNVFSLDVQIDTSPNGRGRPRKYPRIDKAPCSAKEMIESLGPKAFRTVTWRQGTKGPLRARFTAIRVRVADGPRQSRGVHPPGSEAWLVCEQRTNERKYYLSNYPARAPLRQLASLIKARWSCEQAHQQMKEELGLDHFEGRSWHGLHHHAVLTMISFAFLQHLRLRENKF
jgi:SRSO17 transposase